MPDWLRDSVHDNQELHLGTLTARLISAFVLGVAIALIYRFSHRRNEVFVATFIPTLVLLTVLLALVPQIIGGHIARAFSLVGALSIVRFRTIVQDTRDTAFVIFAVVIGMAVGTGYLYEALIALAIIGMAAFVVRPMRSRSAKRTPDWTLSLRLAAGSNPDTLLNGTLTKHLEEHQIVATGTARQGLSLDLTYTAHFRPGSSPNALLLELNQVEGVQNVDLRRG
jgi:uncharacterized membrane protein YhiD involved in acid resistance